MAEAIYNPSEEREALLKMLIEGQEAYLACLADISEDLAQGRNQESGWCILECAEHVAVAEGQMLRMWQKLASPGTTDRTKDEQVRLAAIRGERKAQAPERSRPSGRYSSLAEAREKFIANRQASIDFLRETGDDLRSKTVPHPLIGVVDGYQLFLIMALHPARHAAQINEIAGPQTRAAGSAQSS